MAGHRQANDTAPLRVRAPAKVNLYLRITSRRADGYHTLESLMQKVSLFDVLEMHRKEAGIELYCPDGTLPENSDNLVHKAAALFQETMADRINSSDSGVVITLHKKIPIAAGLGGGSSNAAAVLKGMQHLYGVQCTYPELVSMGLKLGADVPFFLNDSPACWATGIGERLCPAVGINDVALVLVNPGFAVSTKWVYQNFALTKSEINFNLTSSQAPAGRNGCLRDFRDRAISCGDLFNDLEKVTAGKHKEITELKKLLLAEGAEAALMSGSGPTVFGLFKNQDLANESCVRIKKIYAQTFMALPLCKEG